MLPVHIFGPKHQYTDDCSCVSQRSEDNELDCVYAILYNGPVGDATHTRTIIMMDRRWDLEKRYIGRSRPHEQYSRGPATLSERGRTSLSDRPRLSGIFSSYTCIYVAAAGNLHYCEKNDIKITLERK